MEEIENLTQMLISPDVRNAELALKLLQQQPRYIPDLVVPLTILTKLSKNQELKMLAKVVLHLQYTSKVIEQWEQPLEVFVATQKAKTYNWIRFYKLLQYYEKNREIYEPILLNHPEYTSYFEAVAIALMNTFQQYQLAYVYFQKVREKPEFSLQAKFYLAEMIYRFFLPEGKYMEEAPNILAILQEVQTYKPLNAERFFHIMGTICELYTEDIEQAKAYYEQALLLNPDFQQSSFNLARIHFVYEKAYAAARQILEVLVGKYARNTTYWYLLAQVHWEGFQDIQKAEYILKDILTMTRNNHPQTCVSLGDLYLEKQDYALSGQHYKMALSKRPKDIKILLKYANLQAQYLQNQEAAKLLYNKVLELDPEQKEAKKALASF